MITQIHDPAGKRRIARAVLEALPDWFEVEETREAYIAQSADQPFFAALRDGAPVGFLCLKPTGDATVELAVMGVLRECHRQGVGRKLFEAARAYAREAGFAFMQVKTVQMGHYPDYDDTNRFYQSLGFREFEVFPLLWDEANPCQVYVMSL
ncbi:MAG: GNAT family N-acetyltransferase [Clostridia bacterium]|nr:GNAT family N-acetyltransferase [Clostridia bacterium]